MLRTFIISKPVPIVYIEILYPFRIYLVDKAFFEVTDAEIKKTRKLYQEQCPGLYSEISQNDDDIMKILAIGRKHGIEYLQFLFDDQFRYEVKQELAVKNQEHKADGDWFRDGHLAPVQRLGGQQHHLLEYVFKPWRPAFAMLTLSNVGAINDSIQQNVQYIASCAQWIKQLITKREIENDPIMPFQFDLCIAVGPPRETKLRTKKGDKQSLFLRYQYPRFEVVINGYSRSCNVCKGFKSNTIIPDEIIEIITDYYYKLDDVKQSEHYKDYVGNIEEKLKKNNLKYEKIKYKTNSKLLSGGRLFSDLFEAFKKQMDNKLYPHQSRLITMIDRRTMTVKQRNAENEIFMYEPPEDCRDIPKDYVPEWFMNASKTCLLPHMKYKDDMKTDIPGINQFRRESGAVFHWSSAMLCISFVVMDKERIKAHLFWSGEMGRFQAEDITQVLPAIFDIRQSRFDDMNSNFIQNKQKVKKYVDILKETLCDKHFAQFQGSYRQSYRRK